MYTDYLSIKSKRKQKGKSSGACADRRLSRIPLCEKRAGVRVHVTLAISSNSKQEHGIREEAPADTNRREMCCFSSANTS